MSWDVFVYKYLTDSGPNKSTVKEISKQKPEKHS